MKYSMCISRTYYSRYGGFSKIATHYSSLGGVFNYIERAGVGKLSFTPTKRVEGGVRKSLSHAEGGAQ